jgi:hypothetical protein
MTPKFWDFGGRRRDFANFSSYLRIASSVEEAGASGYNRAFWELDPDPRPAICGWSLQIKSLG